MKVQVKVQVIDVFLPDETHDPFEYVGFLVKVKDRNHTSFGSEVIIIEKQTRDNAKIYRDDFCTLTVDAASFGQHQPGCDIFNDS